ncbi:MAG: hypothetical protein BWK75_00070, partial [Candidatus Altiarchaeales archaeon A3]
AIVKSRLNFITGLKNGILPESFSFSGIEISALPSFIFMIVCMICDLNYNKTKFYNVFIY